MFVKGCDMLSYDPDGPSELLPGLKMADKTSVSARYLSKCPLAVWLS